MNIQEFVNYVETNYAPNFSNSTFLQKVVATQLGVLPEVHNWLDAVIKQEAAAAQKLVDEYDKREKEVDDDIKKLLVPPPTPEDPKMEWSTPPDLVANPPPPHEEYPIGQREFPMGHCDMQDKMREGFKVMREGGLD